MPIYLTLQLIRCAACGVAIAPGGLLPRLFTLTSTKGGGGYFLSHYSTITDSFPLRNMILCVARTFLTPHLWATVSDRPPYCLCYITAKLLHFLQFSKSPPVLLFLEKYFLRWVDYFTRRGYALHSYRIAAWCSIGGIECEMWATLGSYFHARIPINCAANVATIAPSGKTKLLILKIVW